MEKVSFEVPGPAGQGRTQLLSQVDLTLEPGQVVALVGRSGVGKTTLLHLAAGLGCPASGRVLCDEQDLARMSQGALSRLRRRHIGLVFQNSLCVSALPVWENAALPLLMDGQTRSQARPKALEMLRLLGLEPWATAAVASLSGGQRRRLGIARVLLGQPQLLLADEPTADLDEETGQAVEQLIFQWVREHHRAALIVTHTDSIKQAADRVVFLSEGRLAVL